MSEPLNYADLLMRWDELPKAERWALGSGDLHNIIDVAVDPEADIDQVMRRSRKMTVLFAEEEA